MRQSTWSVAARNAKLNGIRADFDAGYLRYYEGEQPASSDVDVTDQRVLAELRFAPVAFAPAANGMLIANPIAPDPDARATGAPTWYRCFMADGVTPIHDGSVGPDGQNGHFPPAMIIAHAQVECTEFVISDSPPVHTHP